MDLDLTDVRRHYASLSDEALLELDRNDLVEGAKTCLDEEIERRRLGEKPASAGAEPDWIADAVCTCVFDSFPGRQDAPLADHAKAVLEAAGIPCHLDTQDLGPDTNYPKPAYEIRVMVPAALSLHALSVLDKQIFNVEHEEEWQKHFEELSDTDLLAIRVEDLIDGYLDRANRLRRVYENELERRNPAERGD